MAINKLMNATSSSETNINSTDVILVVLAFFITLIFVAAIKKIYYKVKHKKIYYIFPRPRINGIASIAMIVSLSVAVLILLTIITANAFAVLFRAFPGSRITIEGILIKIGGLLFGPFTGIFIGLLTDTLSVLMTAGIFHYGYFISAMAYGLLSGLIKVIVTYSSNNKLKFSIYSTLFLLITCAICLIYFFTTVKGAILIEFIIQLPPITFPIIASIFATFFSLTIASIWIFYFVSWKYEKLKQQRNKIVFGNEIDNNEAYTKTGRRKKQKSDKFLIFCPIIVCVIANEAVINTIMMPVFDSDLSTLSFEQWLGIRILLFVPMIFLNMIFIYPVYSIISPLVKYNYLEDFMEESYPIDKNKKIEMKGNTNEKNRQ